MSVRPHFRIVEPLPLGHGPLWLDYLVKGLSPAWDITITCPDKPEYRDWSEKVMATTANVQFDWFVFSKKTPWQTILRKPAHIPVVEHTLITILDRWLMNFKRTDDPREISESPLSAIWFLPAFKQPRQSFNIKMLYSRKARRHNREQDMLEHPPHWLSHICVLDQQTANDISPSANQQVHVLPDPWPCWKPISQTEARQALDLPQDQKIFMHLGSDDSRKGLSDCMDAWAFLPESANCLLVKAGRMKSKRLQKAQPLIEQDKMIVRNQWISDEDLNLYVAAADWILLPYRFHRGSSGLLAGAAVAGKPVIVSDYGVLGRRVRENNMGLHYPHLSVDGLAEVILEASKQDMTVFQEGLANYNVQNTPQALTNTFAAIFSRDRWDM